MLVYMSMKIVIYMHDSYDLQGLNPEQLTFFDSKDTNLCGENKRQSYSC